MIRWFALNPVTANLLMAALILMGLLAIKDKIPLEVFPTVKRDVITISTSQPGTTPNDIEQGVTLRIEDAIVDVEGIKEIFSSSNEGVSTVDAEITAGFEPREVLENIKLKVDALSTLPESAERPVITQAEFPVELMSVVVSGNVNYSDKPPLEILIEISPIELQRYQLSLAEVGDIIADNTVEISAGNIRTSQGDILVRTNGQIYNAEGFKLLPIISSPQGGTVLLGDIATITQGFVSIDVDPRFNGEVSLSLKVFRGGNASAVSVAREIRQFIKKENKHLPEGVHINYWQDMSVIVESRLKTLINSAAQGLLLVMLLLALFLRPAVAFWVCIGIPVCFLGAIAVMPVLGVTFNMISLFAFIVVLGIVVDDAIVTGESIFKHQRLGKSSLKAAIDGTHEVALPVTFGILTTVVAFLPVMMVQGSSGELFRIIPLIAIPVLLFSLVESKLILPAHMRHVTPEKPIEELNFLSRWQRGFSRGFERAILKVYKPALHLCLRNKLITMIAVICVTLLVGTYAQTGRIKFVFMPTVDGEVIIAELVMPEKASFEETKEQVDHIISAAQTLKEREMITGTDKSIIEYIISAAGASMNELASNKGIVAIEVQAPEVRGDDIEVSDIADQWRELIGEMPNAKQLSISWTLASAGRPIQVDMKGGTFEELTEINQKITQKLREYDGVYDIRDNLSNGKEEIRSRLKESALSLGLSEEEIAQQTRNAIFGYKLPSIQRNQDEFDVLVRYPQKYRSTLNDIQSLPIQLNNGKTVPLSSVADLSTNSSPSVLLRLDRQRTSSVSADINKESADLAIIQDEILAFTDELLLEYPNIDNDFGGEADEESEVMASLFFGGVLVLIAMYVLLAIPFKSYFQPFIVMSVIPLGFVGALLGHIIMGADLSLLSMLGLISTRNAVKAWRLWMQY